MTAAPAALEAAADPFAAPSAAAGYGQSMPQGPGAAMAMDDAFAATRQAGMAEAAMGVPTGRPGWLVPVIIGLAALILGGGVTLVVMMAR
jgi:hypothetical protein